MGPSLLAQRARSTRAISQSASAAGARIYSQRHEGSRAEYEDALLSRSAGFTLVRAGALCGLAELDLAAEDLSQARGYAAQIERGLETSDLVHWILGLRPHLVCYHVLRASGDPRARENLENAHHLLRERADNLGDPALRRSYLENVAWNREIVSEFAKDE